MRIRGVTSTIWDAKTRKKSPRKKQPRDICAVIDEGFKYFWSRRRLGQFHNGRPE